MDDTNKFINYEGDFSTNKRITTAVSIMIRILISI